MTPLNDRLAHGWSLYQAGAAAQAEQVFRQALQESPDNADGWCILGIICRSQGHSADAVASYREALRLRPNFLESYNNLGNALVDLGKYAEAVECYRKALQLNPDYPQAHNNLGAALRHQGKFEEAAACYRRAIELSPAYADAHNNLGDAYKALGKLAEAESSYRLAIHLRPNHAEAYNNLGAVLVRLERYDEAIAQHQYALQLRPNFADAYNNLANAYLSQRRLEEAVTTYREALRIKPDYAEAYANLGIALASLNRYDEALSCYEEALRLKADYAEAHANMGNVLQEMGHPEEALRHYHQALEIKPDYAEAYDNQAQAKVQQQKMDEARGDFEQALSLRADYAEAHMGRALIWLAQGDYERGLPEYEWRFKTKAMTPFTFEQPVWDGAPLNGRTILVHAEQGLGDTLQFIRYAALVKERGGKVIVACQKPLVKILAGCPGIDQLVPYETPLPKFDVYAPLLSLPRIFGTTVKTIPAAVPYIFANPGLIAHWQQELSRYTACKIGIAWQGNPSYPADRRRSFPLQQLAVVARVTGVQLFSLQKTHGLDQLAEVAGEFSVIDLGSKLDEASGPFMDTAPVMKNLDLVISADTSLAHLAGALGVTAWLPLAFSPEWRWLLEREDSPWYPSVRLFRQPRPGDWESVFARMAQELSNRLPRRKARPITVEMAPGELLDRISILEIKATRINDEAKLANVRRELAVLQAARDRSLEPSPEIIELSAQLRSANELLWQVEDDLRGCEQVQDFGPRFVELARSVYQHNDRRAALKRRLNEMLESDFADEKDYTVRG